MLDEEGMDPGRGSSKENAGGGEWREEGDEGEVDVAIVGGGLSGLALAVGLQERGIQFAVFEKAFALRTDSATAISLAINGIRAVEGLKPGLSHQMLALGTEPEHVYMTVRDEVGRDVRFPLNHRPGELLMIGWKFSQQLLASIVHPSKIRCDRKFLRYRRIQEGVECQFLGENGSIHTVRCKLLVGCDGVWSGVRNVMVGDAPRYMNFLNWNALLHNPDGKVWKQCGNQVHMIHDAAERAVGYLSHLGHGYVLWLLRVLDTDGALAQDHLRNCLKGFDKEDTKRRALQQLDSLPGWHDLRSAVEATEQHLIFERRSMDRIFLDKWSAADGRVLLIADAAHGMYSALGMGARTAFEDSHQLTLELEKAFQQPDLAASIPEAVHRFEQARIPRLRKIHQFATELSEQPQFRPAWTSGLSREQKVQRFNEFIQWTCQYPDNMCGDPNSTYWKEEAAQPESAKRLEKEGDGGGDERARRHKVPPLKARVLRTNK